MAITDHGVMYGVVDFMQRLGKAAGAMPIIGCEVYVAPRSRTDRVHEYDAEARHLILLCKNEVGYRNLCFLDSAAFTEGFYIKPRIDKQLLREHAEGLIALSACQSGEVPRLILAGNYEAAKAAALEMRELLGRTATIWRFRTTPCPGTRRSIRTAAHPSGDRHSPGGDQRRSLPPREDAQMQDTLMCIQMGKTVTTPTA